MTWETAAVVAILVLVIGGASVYIYKSKKKGAKCIGCPNSGKCSGNCSDGSCH